jgi:hypothetical protein
LELCKRWEAVIAKEKEEQLCDYELILAWSLERAGKKENDADQIWRLASSFHQDFPCLFYSSKYNIELLDVVRLMWETEHAFSRVTKLEIKIATAQFADQKEVYVKELVQDIPKFIRSRLLAPFQSLSTLSDLTLTLTQLKSRIELQNDLETYWRKNSELLVEAVICRNRLITFFSEAPGLIEFIETKFNSFFQPFCDQCETIKTYLE